MISYTNDAELYDVRVGDLVLTPHEKHIIVVTVSATNAHNLDGIIGIIVISYRQQIERVRGGMAHREAHREMKRSDVRVGDFWVDSVEASLILVDGSFTSDETTQFAFMCVRPEGHITWHAWLPEYFHWFTLVSR